GIELDGIAALMTADPAQHLAVGQAAAQKLRAGGMEWVINGRERVRQRDRFAIGSHDRRRQIERAEPVGHPGTEDSEGDAPDQAPSSGQLSDRFRATAPLTHTSPGSGMRSWISRSCRSWLSAVIWTGAADRKSV